MYDTFSIKSSPGYKKCCNAELCQLCLHGVKITSRLAYSFRTSNIWILFSTKIVQLVILLRLMRSIHSVRFVVRS